MRRIILLLPLLAALVACDTLTGPGPTPRTGRIIDLEAIAASPDAGRLAVGALFHAEDGFVVAGSDSAVIYRSEDGRSWSRVAIERPGGLAAVAHGAGHWVAVGRGVGPDEHGVILRSGDGVDWERVEGAPSVRWSDVAYGNGRFVAVGWDPAVDLEAIAVSDDGVAWEVVARANLLGIRVSFGDGAFVLHGEAGAVGRSADAKAWIVHPLEPMSRVTALGHSPEGWLALGIHDCCFGEEPDRIAYFTAASPDAKTWTVEERQTRSHIASLAHGGGVWVGTGGATVVRSADGVIWATVLEEEGDARPHVVARFDDLFIAVGRDATWWSDDGQQWTRTPLETETSP